MVVKPRKKKYICYMEGNKNSFDSKNQNPITSVSEPMIAYNISPSPLQILANILGLDTLSVKLKNTLDLLALAEKGFPVKVIKKLQKHTRFTNREMGKVLDMSESTLQRRLREKQNLDKRQSESAVNWHPYGSKVSKYLKTKTNSEIGCTSKTKPSEEISP